MYTMIKCDPAWHVVGNDRDAGMVPGRENHVIFIVRMLDMKSGSGGVARRGSKYVTIM